MRIPSRLRRNRWPSDLGPVEYSRTAKPVRPRSLTVATIVTSAVTVGEVAGVDQAKVADDDGTRGHRGQRADPVAADPQQAAADHGRTGVGGIENVRVRVLRRAGQRRIAVGWERRYHPMAGYWTVGVLRPREGWCTRAMSEPPTSHMHIALVNHHVGGKAGGGGGVRLMLELGAGLVRRGHRVTVACYDFLEGSEFSYAADQLEIRSVRRGAFELPAGNMELARRFWLDMPKVARLVAARRGRRQRPRLARRYDPGASPRGACRVPLVWTRNNESLWERAIVPKHDDHRRAPAAAPRDAGGDDVARPARRPPRRTRSRCSARSRSRWSAAATARTL